MRFSEYEVWLDNEHIRIAAELEPNYIEVGPFLTPTQAPDSPPWKMEWAVIFSDGKFFRVTENWFARLVAVKKRGHRQHFSFHYGLANPHRGTDGMPLRSPQYPAIFRADCDRYGPHLHFDGADHIPQSRVLDLRISDIEPFDFARAVLKHRSTHEGFDKILKFRVKP